MAIVGTGTDTSVQVTGTGILQAHRSRVLCTLVWSWTPRKEGQCECHRRGGVQLPHVGMQCCCKSLPSTTPSPRVCMPSPALAGTCFLKALFTGSTHHAQCSTQPSVGWRDPGAKGSFEGLGLNSTDPSLARPLHLLEPFLFLGGPGSTLCVYLCASIFSS